MALATDINSPKSSEKPSQKTQATVAPDGMSEQEWTTRVELAATYRLVHIHGWTSQVYNHITARIPGRYSGQQAG